MIIIALETEFYLEIDYLLPHECATIGFEDHHFVGRSKDGFNAFLDAGILYVAVPK